jgi:hypothetical protein
MKATKFIVGTGVVVGIAGCFMDWAAIDLSGIAEGLSTDRMPTAGMDHGGPVILFLLALPLIAALLGLLKRMGRGMGALAFVGGLLAALLAMVKYADIEDAGALLADNGMGSVEVAGGYWVMFAGCTIAMVGGLIALIKPEPKPAPPAMPQAPAYHPVAQ